MVTGSNPRCACVKFRSLRDNGTRGGQIAAHLALHLVDLAEGEHALADDGPRLVGVGVVACDLGGDHEGGEEEAVAGGAAGGGEARVEALEEEERRECDRAVKAGAVEGVGDEM